MKNWLKRFTGLVYSINIRIGDAISWISILLVGIGVFEVVARFVFNRPTEWGYELLLMLGAAMYVLSWGYLHAIDKHVKIDLFYNKLSVRVQKIVDVACAVVIHLPLMGVLTYISFKKMWRSWAIGEVSIDTTWYPPLGPLKTIIFLGILLFTMQTITRLIQDVSMLVSLYRGTSDQKDRS